MAQLDEKGFVYLSGEGRPFLCRMWGGKPWVFYWHADQHWVSDHQIMTAAEVGRLPHNLLEYQQNIYREKHLAWERTQSNWNDKPATKPDVGELLGNLDKAVLQRQMGASSKALQETVAEFNEPRLVKELATSSSIEVREPMPSTVVVPDLDAKDYHQGKRILEDGEPCHHDGCLHHTSHPCEGCGRIGARGRSTVPTHGVVQFKDDPVSFSRKMGMLMRAWDDEHPEEQLGMRFMEWLAKKRIL